MLPSDPPFVLNMFCYYIPDPSIQTILKHVVNRLKKEISKAYTVLLQKLNW